MSETRTTRCPGFLDANIRIICKWLPARWVVGIMAFFGTMNVYSLRVNLSAAIVGMVDYEGLKKLHNDQGNNSFDDQLQNDNISVNHIDQCGKFESNATQESFEVIGKLFLWDENAQGLALASYFYGYVCAQVFGAWIARKLGRVRVWSFSMLVASVCTILLPVMLEIGFGAFVAARIVIGLFSGVTYPIMHGMWSMWAPPGERGKLMVLQFAGGPLGSFLVLPLSGALTKKFGWTAVFYVTGTAGTVWSLLWWILIYDSPSEHPRISIKEKEHIESSLGHDGGVEKSKKQQKRPVPWFALMSSIRVWAVIIPHFASNFGPFIFLTMLPTYLRTMLNFDVKSSGAVSSIPYIFQVFLFFVSGWSADWVISKGVRMTTVRKVWSSIGLFLPGIALAASGYTGCSVALIMLLFTVPIAVDSFTIPGFKTSMLELAPAFAGIVLAVANTIATASGFIAPQIAGIMRKAHRDDPVQGWRSLFWLGSALYFVGGLVFVIFGTSDVQEWARPAQSESPDEKKSLIKDQKAIDEVQV